MTDWGSTKQGLRVGIDVSMSPSTVSSSTDSVKITVVYYVASVNTGWADSQTLTLSGTWSGTSYDYYMSSGYGQSVTKKIATRSFNATPYYSGTRTWTFGAQVSGAHNGANPSNSVTFTLPKRPAARPSSPGTPSISNITDTTADTSWSAPSDDGGDSIDYYNWQISRNSSFSPIFKQTTPTSRSQYVVGMDRGTSYYVRVRAHNSAGYGSFSGSRLFKTEDVPSAPGTPVASDVGQTEATLTWAAAASNGASITNYYWQVSTSSSFGSTVKTGNNGTSRTVTVTGLDPEVTYYFRVRATNAHGTGGFSSSRSFRTFYEDISVYPTPTPTLSITSPQSTATPTFTVGLVEDHPFEGGTNYIHYQFATDSAFTANLIEGQKNDAQGGSLTVPVTSDIPLLIQGQWYVRVRRSGSSSLKMSDWSSTKTVTITHVPSVAISSPTNSAYIAQTSTHPFKFSATDPWSGDSVTAYEIVIENNSTGAEVMNTGKKVYSNPWPFGALSVTLNISTLSLDTALRWKVRVWDSTDTPSQFSGYSVFRIVPLPDVSITYPSDSEVIDTGSPTFTWDAILTSERTISSTSVVVIDDTTSEEVWSIVTGPGVTEVMPPNPILRNEVLYEVTVTVTDNRGLQGSASVLFSTSYTPPESISYEVDIEDIETEGYITVNWSNSSFDDTLINWNVYRRELPAGAWEPIATVDNLATPYYRDFLFKPGVQYMYNVTQVADRSGIALESPVGVTMISGSPEAESTIWSPYVTNYWIVVPDVPYLSLLIPNVTADSNTLEYEKEVIHLIGRGRHMDRGDRLGYDGSLTFQVRQSEVVSEIRLQLEDLYDTDAQCYLRTPFGKVFPVALGDPSWTALPGTGLAEMGDVTIPYSEVG